MLGEIRGEVRFKEPLSFHTSLRIGGPADIFIVPQDVEDIRLALSFAEREQLSLDVIGGGNNLLVSDRGVRGVVLKLEGCLGRAEFHGEEAVAGAGVGLSALIREAAALNLGGIECLVGVPATVGGAVAMNAGTQAAREAGNMVDLDSNPTKLIEIVEIGKQLLMTRGALTTFSIANDVAKYFAIIPALFIAFYPQLQALNIMNLSTPQSAILSAIIFNALIIIALIPLALKGVAYRPIGAGPLLRRNLLIYGLGGIIIPFVGIKVIDVLVTALHLA